MKYFAGLLLFLCTLAGTAQAAEENAQTVPAAPTMAVENAALQNTLDLQYQIQLLKRLITREQTVNQMASAAMAIGLDQPVLPAPSRSLCAAVPANIPCAQIYPDLYPGFDVTPVATIQTTRVSAPTRMHTNHLVAAKNVPPAAPALYWLDITCLQETCSALLASDPQNSKSYARLREGQQMGQAKVTRIGVSGVTVSQNGREYHVPPAPRG